MNKHAIAIGVAAGLVLTASYVSAAPVEESTRPKTNSTIREEQGVAPTAPLMAKSQEEFLADAPFTFMDDAISATNALLQESMEEAMEDGEVVAQNSKRTARKRSSAKTGRAAKLPAKKKGNAAFSRALKLAREKDYAEASKLLFSLSRNPEFARNSAQIKYILGLTLFELKLNQAAAFVFYDVIRQESRQNPKSKYLKQSLEKLAFAADSLESDVLLRYAIKQVKEEEFPAANRDMLYYRTGEVKLQEKDYENAVKLFAKVRSSSQFFHRSRYKLALALAESGQHDKSQAVFEELAENATAGGVTDVTRVSALMGRARVLYQKQNFEGAVEAYRAIPRDTGQWHEALFESTWAMLRDGRFRSALSNFHSLHSSYYEDVYQPESLYLRAIVYFYICKYDDMGKVLELFERVYRPVHRDVRNVLSTYTDPGTLFKEISKVHGDFEAIRAGQKRKGLAIPFSVARKILKEGDVSRTFSYLDKLNREKKRLDEMPGAWKSSGIGVNSRRVVEKRIESTQTLAGKQVRYHLIAIDKELNDLFEQISFLRLEMITSKKDVVRKEIAGRGLPRERVDESGDRNFYIQNGYEYWPFTGEYWLDEIGNYHYVGVKACE